MPFPRLLPLLPVLVLCGCVQHSAAWKAADLDRNEFDLALFRGADTGSEVADWASHGEPVLARGSVEGEDLRIVMAYESESSTGFFATTETVRTCFEFTAEDQYGVDFEETDCPG